MVMDFLAQLYLSTIFDISDYIETFRETDDDGLETIDKICMQESDVQPCVLALEMYRLLLVLWFIKVWSCFGFH